MRERSLFGLHVSLASIRPPPPFPLTFKYGRPSCRISVAQHSKDQLTCLKISSSFSAGTSVPALKLLKPIHKLVGYAQT